VCNTATKCVNEITGVSVDIVKNVHAFALLLLLLATMQCRTLPLARVEEQR
jgi:hypothetical protein